MASPLPVVILTLVLAATLASCGGDANPPPADRKAAADTAAPAAAPAPPPPTPTRELTWSKKVDMTLWSPGRVKAYQAALQQAPPPTLAILRIPRLKLEVPVYDGTEDAVLDLAAGRIEDTALPGTKGNVGIAAHRDGFFRVLKDIQQGDALVLDTPVATEQYPSRVDPDHHARRRERDRSDTGSRSDACRLLPLLSRGCSPAAVHRPGGTRGWFARRRLTATTRSSTLRWCREVCASPPRDPSIPLPTVRST